MKIGIITLWQSSDNYGQQLQCWALQQQLLKMGHEPYLVRYDTSLKLDGWNKFLKQFKSIIKILLILPALKDSYNNRVKRKSNYTCDLHKELRQFKEFRDLNIIQSKEFYRNIAELRKNPPVADAYIVGSDQVWSYLLSYEESKSYYLDFGNSTIKRIAYAASFSLSTYPNKLKNKLKQQLDKFDAISVREKTGVSICKSVGVSAQLVLDPTLLLNKSTYESIAKKENVNLASFIYVYHLNVDTAEDINSSEIFKLADEKKMSVLATTSSGMVKGKELLTGVQYDYSTIPSWIYNIKTAKFVVTTSFHGVVFCLLLHTNFVWIPLKGICAKGNSRVVDLLSILDMNNHIYSETNDIASIYNSNIDWNNVDSKVEDLRKKSIDFLEHNLK